MGAAPAGVTATPPLHSRHVGTDGKRGGRILPPLDEPVVFIDFDGVLRRSSAPRGRLEGHLIDNLVALFARFTRLRGVFSTNWRYHHSLAELCSLVEPSLAARMLDVTPEIALRGIASRHSEIQAWRTRHAHAGAWVAIDDQVTDFPAGCAELCACDPTRGFDTHTAARCTAMLIEQALGRVRAR